MPPQTLLDRILASGRHDLELLAARGLVPAAPEEVAEAQVALASSPDPEVARLAEDSLMALEAPIASTVVAAPGCGEALLAFLGLRHPHPTVREAVLRRRGVPLNLLEAMAPSLPADLQEILLQREDAIVERPGILDALEENPELSAFARRRIGELREHLVPPTAAAGESLTSAWPLEEGIEEASDGELQEAVEMARAQPPEGESDEVTGLSEGQIRTLPVPVRLRLSRGAPRGLRSILVRDHNAQVAVSVLKYNSLPDSEVEQIAGNRAVVDDVLDLIGRYRQWTRKYPIALALTRNPRTPPGLALRLLGQLSVRDLRILSLDRNASDVIRRSATRMYRIKQG